MEDKICEIGEKIILIPSEIGGKIYFLNKHEKIKRPIKHNDVLGTFISKTIEANGEPICEEGVIMEAPYFLIEYSCEELSISRKISNLRNIFEGRNVLLKEFYQANTALREEIENKNMAYDKLKDYADRLEEMVDERTLELRETQAKLVESEKRSLEHRITGGLAHEM